MGKVKKSHKVTNLRKLLIADLLSSFELFHLNQTRTVETKDKVRIQGCDNVSFAVDTI